MISSDPERTFSKFEMTLVNKDNDRSIDFYFYTEPEKTELTTADNLKAILEFTVSTLETAVGDFSIYDKYEFTEETSANLKEQCKKNFENAKYLFNTEDINVVKEQLAKLQSDADFLLGNEDKPE